MLPKELKDFNIKKEEKGNKESSFFSDYKKRSSVQSDNNLTIRYPSSFSKTQANARKLREVASAALKTAEKAKDATSSALTPEKTESALSNTNKNDITNTVKTTHVPSPLVTKEREGTRIKKEIKDILSKKHGTLDTRHLFEDIDDETVEKNIPLAKSAINKNIDSGALDKNYSKKYSHLLDGLSLSYAADELGNAKEAKKAREAAYFSTAPDKPANHSGSIFFSNNVDFKNDYLNYFDSLTKSSNGIFSDFSKNIGEKHNVEPLALESSPLVYYGHIDSESANKDGDLKYCDLSEKQLSSTKGFNLLDNTWSEDLLLKDFRLHAQLFSTGEMGDVLDDMITHFADGTGSDYSNPTLTKIVSNHPKTQEFMKDFTSVFSQFVSNSNGDISSFANSETFRDALKANDVYLSKYDYYNTDIVTGLTMAIHSWTESEVTLKSFNVNDDGTYDGTLRFTFKDNFGLDTYDIKKFSAISGFKSWYNLQHSTRFKGKYKPFKTVVTIDYPISGKI